MHKVNFKFMAHFKIKIRSKKWLNPFFINFILRGYVMKHNQDHYQDLLIKILDDRENITTSVFLDFLKKRKESLVNQQIVKNIISNRHHLCSPFSKGILNYNENTGKITKNR